MTGNSAGRPWLGRTLTGHYRIPASTTRPSQDGPGQSQGVPSAYRMTTRPLTAQEIRTGPHRGTGGLQKPRHGSSHLQEISTIRRISDIGQQKCAADLMRAGVVNRHASTGTPAAHAKVPTLGSTVATTPWEEVVLHITLLRRMPSQVNTFEPAPY